MRGAKRQAEKALLQDLLHVMERRGVGTMILLCVLLCDGRKRRIFPSSSTRPASLVANTAIISQCPSRRASVPHGRVRKRRVLGLNVLLMILMLLLATVTRAVDPSHFWDFRGCSGASQVDSVGGR